VIELRLLWGWAGGNVAVEEAVSENLL
jgi:hypothetical protein